VGLEERERGRKEYKPFSIYLCLLIYCNKYKLLI
jgi:hypothetical protein